MLQIHHTSYYRRFQERGATCSTVTTGTNLPINPYAVWSLLQRALSTLWMPLLDWRGLGFSDRLF